MPLQAIYAKFNFEVISVSPAIITFLNPTRRYLKIVYLYFGPDMSRGFTYTCKCRYDPTQSLVRPNLLVGAK